MMEVVNLGRKHEAQPDELQTGSSAALLSGREGFGKEMYEMLGGEITFSGRIKVDGKSAERIKNVVALYPEGTCMNGIGPSPSNTLALSPRENYSAASIPVERKVMIKGQYELPTDSQSDSRVQRFDAVLNGRGHILVQDCVDSLRKRGISCPNELDQSFTLGSVISPFVGELAANVLEVSDLSGGCGELVIEEIKRIMSLRRGRVSCNKFSLSQSEALQCLARLAMLKHEVLGSDELWSRNHLKGNENIIEKIESRFAGALSFRSKGSHHPVVYLAIGALMPDTLLLQILPGQFQLLLLKLFHRLWMKLASISLQRKQLISHAVVVLDLGDLSLIDITSYSTHRVLHDAHQVLMAFAPLLVYKLIVYKCQHAKDFVWELLRPTVGLGCRIVIIEDEAQLRSQIEGEKPFLLHTLGGFNEASQLHFNRPIYKLRTPPLQRRSIPWLLEGTNSRIDDAKENDQFWGTMMQLYTNFPDIEPERVPVEDEIDCQRSSFPQHTEFREDRRDSSYKWDDELRDAEQKIRHYVASREYLTPHFIKALDDIHRRHPRLKAYKTRDFCSPCSCYAAAAIRRHPLDLTKVYREPIKVSICDPKTVSAAAELRVLVKRMRELGIIG